MTENWRTPREGLWRRAKEPLWRIGIAWNRNSEKLPLMGCFVKVVQAIVASQEVER